MFTHLLFRSRWIALAWAISLCLTIARFFSAGGGAEGLQIAKVQAQDAQTEKINHPNPWSIKKKGDDAEAGKAGH